MRCPNCGHDMRPTDDIEPGVRATDPNTSHKAALFVRPRAGSQRARILDAVAQRTISGMTYGEVRNATGIQAPWKRISELLEGGWLEWTGETRRIADTGAEGRVYRLGPSYFTDLAKQRMTERRNDVTHMPAQLRL